MPAGKGTYGNKIGRPRNKRTGEDFLDRETWEENYRKGLKEAQDKDRKRNEKKKREADAKKFVEAEEKKWMEKHGIKRTTNDRIPKITKRVAPVKKGKAVKLTHKAVKKK